MAEKALEEVVVVVVEEGLSLVSTIVGFQSKDVLELCWILHLPEVCRQPFSSWPCGPTRRASLTLPSWPCVQHRLPGQWREQPQEEEGEGEGGPGEEGRRGLEQRHLEVSLCQGNRLQITDLRITKYRLQITDYRTACNRVKQKV